MSKQMRLFEEPLPGWVVRLWERVDRDRRQEVVTILAEMGSKAVTANGPPGKLRKEDEDEP